MQTISYDELRQRISGLVDPNQEVPAELLAMQRALAIKFAATLPQLFGRDLDRASLWDKIGHALEVGIARAPSGDVERFTDIVLEQICAEDGQVSRSVRLASLLMGWQDASHEERVAFLAYVARHRRPLLSFARQEWERYKADRSAGADLSWWQDPVELVSEEMFAND